MKKSKNADEIADLLNKLQKAGAKVTKGDAKGAAITKKAIEGLKGAVPQDFTAWVSWSKSF